MVPQAYGSPLYILLGHLVALLPGSLTGNMTFWLSVVPSAVTVGTVFLTARKLGLKQSIAIVCVLGLMACPIFLSQSTILEEYAIATMFIALAFYSYVSGRKNMAVLFLALGSAVHVICVAISVIWLISNLKDWKQYVKPILFIYLPVVISGYGFILWLMDYQPIPFLSGRLSLQGVLSYIGGTETIGSLSLAETPKRLLQAFCIFIVSLNAGLVPLIAGIKKPRSPAIKTIVLTFVFCLWLYITDTDFTTWTFTIFAMPLVFIAVGYGLTRLPARATYIVGGVAVLLIIANGFFMNANILNRQNPEAEKYQASIQELPDNSVVVLSSGGPYGLGIRYAIAEGKPLVMLFLAPDDTLNNQIYLDYKSWLEEEHGIVGYKWTDEVNYCLERGDKVFVAYTIQPQEWIDKINQNYTVVEYNEYFSELLFQNP